MSHQTVPGDIPTLTLGWRLKMALGKMRSQDMADALGVTRGTVSRWMNDEGAPPRKAYVYQWALITRVNPEWLLTGQGSGDGTDPSGRTSADCRSRGVVSLPGVGRVASQSLKAA